MSLTLTPHRDGAVPSVSTRPAVFCALLLALALDPFASVQAADAAAPTASGVPKPVTLKACDDKGQRCSAWTFTGNQGTGIGPKGETEKLTVTSAGGMEVEIQRVDVSGPSQGLTADYRGLFKGPGKGFEGTVTSSWPGHWDKQEELWTAKFDPSNAPPPVARAKPNGILIGAWKGDTDEPPIQIGFDDGKKVSGALRSPGGYAVFDGRYVAADRVEFTIHATSPKGCQITILSHWHIIGEGKVETVFDPWSACGYTQGRKEDVYAKLNTGGRSAQAEANNLIVGGLLELFLGGAGGGPEHCDGHDSYGRCASQAELDAEFQRRMQEVRNRDQ